MTSLRRAGNMVTMLVVRPLAAGSSRRAALLLFAAAGFALVGAAGCKVTEDDKVARAPCRAGEFYDVRTGVCAIPSNHEDAYRGYLYERIARDSSTTPVTYQISTVSWLSPSDLQTLLTDAAVLRVTEIDFFLPHTLRGTRVPQPVEPSWAGTSTVDIALKQVVLDLQTSFPSRTSEIQTSLSGTDAVRIAVFRIQAFPDQIATFWTRHSSSIRLIQTVSNDVDELQRPLEPDEAMQ